MTLYLLFLLNPLYIFLATLVALHFTPVSEWAEFQTSIAWSLRACYCATNIHVAREGAHMKSFIVELISWDKDVFLVESSDKN